MDIAELGAKVWKWVAGIAGVVLVVILVAHFAGNFFSKKAAQADTQAAVFQNAVAPAVAKATEEAAAETVAKAQVAVLTAKSQVSERQLAILQARVLAAEQKLAQVPKPTAPESEQEQDKDVLIAGLKDSNAALVDENIGLKKQIDAQVMVIQDADAKAAFLQTALEASQKSAALRQVAYEAQLSATKAAKVEGMFEGGGAVGAAWLIVKLLAH